MGASLLSVVVAKELHHALDFRPRLPTVVFHSVITSTSGSSGDGALAQATQGRRRSPAGPAGALARQVRSVDSQGSQEGTHRSKRAFTTTRSATILVITAKYPSTFLGAGRHCKESSRFQRGSRSQAHDSVVSFIFLSLARYYPKNSDEDHFGSPTFEQRFTSIFEQSYGCTLWYSQEYYRTTGAFNWNTRVASLRFNSCKGGAE